MTLPEPTHRLKNALREGYCRRIVANGEQPLQAFMNVLFMHGREPTNMDAARREHARVAAMPEVQARIKAMIRAKDLLAQHQRRKAWKKSLWGRVASLFGAKGPEVS